MLSEVSQKESNRYKMLSLIFGLYRYTAKQPKRSKGKTTGELVHTTGLGQFGREEHWGSWGVKGDILAIDVYVTTIIIRIINHKTSI